MSSTSGRFFAAASARAATAAAAVAGGVDFWRVRRTVGVFMRRSLG